MAKYDDGILGSFAGRVGTVVGAKWKGLNIMRKRPHFSKNRTFSGKQLEQQEKFALANRFFRRFTQLLRTSFEEVKGQTQRGAAFRTMLKEAVLGLYPNYSVDYSKILVAKGSLEPAWGAVASSTEVGKIHFNWTDTTALTGAYALDNSILVAYCEELNVLIYTLNGATRITAEGELDVPFFSGKTVQTWMAFRSADARKTADSVYTGSFMVA